ncbi:MAG: NUDIX hydrolase [Chitinispirillaceae bacterium]|nr:NUDIX hydrolase [Chitinispirillaceae bacterium]
MNQSTRLFKVDQWRRNVSRAGCMINTVSFLKEIFRKNGDHLFSLLDVDVEAPEGYRLPHIVFIRGHAVVVVPLLVNRDNGEERFLMVRQRRIGNGRSCLEFPAGMIDRPDDDPADVAVRELFEETGLGSIREELVRLAAQPLYSSAGASDEAVFFFGCVKQLPGDEFTAFHHRAGGNDAENEHIAVDLLTREEAEPQLTSIQARLGLYLFESYRGNKMLFVPPPPPH